MEGRKAVRLRSRAVLLMGRRKCMVGCVGGILLRLWTGWTGLRSCLVRPAKYVRFIPGVQTLLLGTRSEETLFRSDIRSRTVRYLNTRSICG